MSGVILAIKNSNFFVGNNSGPINLSAALGVKTFGLIANAPISELKYSKIKPITPVNYIDNVFNKNNILNFYKPKDYKIQYRLLLTISLTIIVIYFFISLKSIIGMQFYLLLGPFIFPIFARHGWYCVH